MTRRASRQPLSQSAHDWKYGRHIYHFKAGAGRFVKRILARWRRHNAKREARALTVEESTR
jgi:hypothetical protein